MPQFIYPSADSQAVNVHSTSRRARVASWVRRRGVDIGEVVSIGASLIYAWRAVDIQNGVPVAPLTSKTFLNIDGGAWFWVLMINGSCVLGALLAGWLTNNTYRIRSYVSLGSSCAWVVIAVAALCADMPLSVVAGYFFTCSISWATALILLLKAKYAETRTLIERETEI